MAKPTNSRSMRYTCLDVRSPDVNFLRKVVSCSHHDGVAYTRHPWRGSADADIVSAFPLSFNTFQENINTLRQTSRHDIPSTVGVLFTDSAKIHRITENSGINVLGVNNFLHNCRKDLKQRNCFFYRTFFYSISTIFISLRPF